MSKDAASFCNVAITVTNVLRQSPRKKYAAWRSQRGYSESEMGGQPYEVDEGLLQSQT